MRSEDGMVVVGRDGGTGVGGVVDIPVDDDATVQEHDCGGVESDELSVAQNSWNTFRGKSRRPGDPELNLKRPWPGKAIADMTICASGITVSGVFRVAIGGVCDIKGKALNKSSSSAMEQKISSSDPR